MQLVNSNFSAVQVPDISADVEFYEECHALCVRFR